MGLVRRMSQTEAVTAQIVDWSNWEQENIHIPGSIQPHGILLALKEPELEILQVSNNTYSIIGIAPDDLLGKPLKALLDSKQISSLKSCLLADFETVNPLRITVKTNNKKIKFDGIIHRQNCDVLILDLEPTDAKLKTNFFNFHKLVNISLIKMQNASTLQELCQIFAKEVRKLTGFDRVMIYQFDREGAGTVIAEDKLESLNPYLDLHYPATDIPKRARELYSLNLLRLIADINYQPALLIPAHNPLTNSPLDLSLSVLRSVSPCHLQYLKNMGVTGSMSISLKRKDKLWGLCACHHYSPKHVPYEIRTACEFLGQVMALEMPVQEDNEDKDYQIKINKSTSNLVKKISRSEDFLDVLDKSESELLDLVSAQGAAIFWDSDCIVIGKVPEKAEVQKLIEWLENKIDNNVFCTDSLPKLYPAADKFKELGSGLLALAISKNKNTCILWFRPEVIQTVNWAGNPDNPVEVARDGIPLLSPRKSFELWQETVKSTSLPWKQCEINEALELRTAIINIVLRKADELAKINIELERSNTELDAFAYIASHDLKEPLRGIHNYSSFLLEDYADVLNEDGISKLQTVVRLTQRMEDLINSLLHFSRLGRVELSMTQTNLNEVVKQVIDVLNISLKETKLDIRISRPLPSIRCDKVQISEVFSNLIGNALKYNDKEEKWVEIGFVDWKIAELRESDFDKYPEIKAARERLQSAQKNLSDESEAGVVTVFYVKDNGIGIPDKHREAIFRIFKRLHPSKKYGGGTGAGLTIAKKIVERHNGSLWVESTYGKGSTFYFTLPS